MPYSPARPCPGKGPRYRSCPNLIRGKQKCCPECEPFVKRATRAYDKERDQDQPWRVWMHSTRWRRASGAHKAEHPLCAECERHGRLTPVYVTDHIKPHNGDYDLFWDPANWESKCNACHEEKHKGERWGRQ